MKIITIKEYYTSDLCRKHPDKLFIFGDNLDRYGKKGQAIIRDEPNTFGIATKVEPTMKKSAFFDDAPSCFQVVDEDIDRMFELAKDKGFKFIVVPWEGIGTGLAKLREKAPKLLRHIHYRLELCGKDGKRIKLPTKI